MNLCEVCQKQASKRCSGCGAVYYCSIVCQKVNWKKHKLDCRMDNTGPKNISPSEKDKKEPINCALRDTLEKLIINSEGKEKLQVEAKPFSPDQKKEHVNHKLSAIADKGMGLIASRDIQTGELVLKDDQVLKCDKCTEYDLFEMIEIYHRRFLKLPSHIQKDIMSLYCNPSIQEKYENCLKGPLPLDISQRQKFIKFVSICHTNSFSITQFGYEKDENYGGIYLLAARINHSCHPNLQWYFKGSTIKFKAAFPITKGDELTISYFDPSDLFLRPTIQVMRSHIAETLGFDCRCKLCCNKDKKKHHEIENHIVQYWRLFTELEQKTELWRSSYRKSQDILQNPNMSGNTDLQDNFTLGKVCLRIGKDIISQMERRNVHNVGKFKQIAAQTCYSIAIQIKDEKMAKYFAEQEREATLYME